MSQENVEVVRKLYDCWARGQTPVDAFDPDVEFARIGPGLTGDVGEWRGVASMLAAMATYLDNWAGFQIRAEQLIGRGDQVLVLTRQSGRARQGGVPFDKALADLFTLRNGKIVRYEAYWDRTDALEAAGLSQ